MNENKDMKLLTEIFWALVLWNIANLFLFFIKTNDEFFVWIINMLDWIIFPLVWLYLLRRTEKWIEKKWCKIMANILIPIIIIVIFIIGFVDSTKVMAKRWPDCKPDSKLIELYEKVQIEIFYDISKEECQKQ